MQLLLNKKFRIFFIVSVLISSSLFSLQFGDGTDEDSLIPVKVMDEVTSVSALLPYNTLVIKSDKSLWATGYNAGKYLNIDTVGDINKFVKIMDNVKSVSGNSIIKEDGSLWQLNEDGLKKIDDDVIKVAYGWDAIMYIKMDNSLWAFGKDYYGMFGLGIERSISEKPVKLKNNIIDVFCNSIYSLIVTKDHELYISGSHYLPDPYKSPTYSFIKVAEEVRSVAEGFYITKENQLYAFGFSAHGALGIGDTKKDVLPIKIMDDVKKVSSSQTYTFILKFDGSLYGSGGRSPNYFGALGTGNLKPLFYPTLIQRNVSDISAGSHHSAFIKEDGSLWMSGANSYPPLL